jgi:hypothetical protein
LRAVLRNPTVVSGFATERGASYRYRSPRMAEWCATCPAAMYARASLFRLERVEDCDLELLEITHVSGGDSKSVDAGRSGDHSVLH